MRRTSLVLVPLCLAGCILGPYPCGPHPMSKGEIQQMSRAGARDEEIVGLLRRDGIERPLTADDVIELKEAGVSDEVIKAAVEAPVPVLRRTAPPHVVFRGPSIFELFFAGVVGYHIGRHYHYRCR